MSDPVDIIDLFSPWQEVSMMGKAVSPDPLTFDRQMSRNSRNRMSSSRLKVKHDQTSD